MIWKSCKTMQSNLNFDLKAAEVFPHRKEWHAAFSFIKEGPQTRHILSHSWALWQHAGNVEVFSVEIQRSQRHASQENKTILLRSWNKQLKTPVLKVGVFGQTFIICVHIIHCPPPRKLLYNIFVCVHCIHQTSSLIKMHSGWIKTGALLRASANWLQSASK